MEFRVNLDLDLLTKLERGRSVSWYTPIHDTKVTLTLAPGGVDPVVAENQRLRDTLESVRRDLLSEQGDPLAWAMEITNPEHPYYENLREMNRALGRPVEDVS